MHDWKWLILTSASIHRSCFHASFFGTNALNSILKIECNVLVSYVGKRP